MRQDERGHAVASHRSKSSWLDNLAAYLTSSPEIIRRQILAQLFTSKIYKSIRNNYLVRFGFDQSASHSAPPEAGSNCVGAAGLAPVAPFPEIGRFISHYERFIIIILFLIVIKNFFQQTIARILLIAFDSDHDGKLFGKPPVCLVPGRLVLHEVFRNRFSGFAALVNLTYRLATRYLNRPFAFSLVDFMIQDDKSIGEYYRSYDEALIRGPQEGYHEANQAFAAHPFTRFMCYEIKLPMNSKASNFRFFYRLRGNRTRWARSKLKRNIALVTIVGYLMYFSLALPLTFIVSPFIFCDFGYLYAYKGCDLELEHHYATYTGHRWFWVTPTAHRLCMMVADVIENYVVWLETIAGAVSFLTLPYYLIDDLVLCWDQFHKRVERACHAKRSLYYRNESSSSSAAFHACATGAIFNMPQLAFAAKSSSSIRCIVSGGGGGGGGGHEIESRTACMCRVADEADAELQEIRWELSDLCEQISHVDLLINDQVSFACMFWFGSLLNVIHSAISHYVKYNSDFVYELIGLTLPTLISVGLVIALIPTTLACSLIFRIYAKSLVTYTPLCSLLAYDQASGWERVRFYEMLSEYFVHMKRNCFKLFHMYPFKTTSYLWLVGWSVSVIAVLSSLAYRTDHKTQLL
jgi:hypothetical protein